MKPPLTILCLALLSLSGCTGWMGPAFYGPNEAVNPFPPGRYRVQSDIGDKKEMVVRWDGHHLFEDGQSRNMDADLRNLTLVPLVVAGRQIFIVQGRIVDRDDVAFYGVLERTDGRYRADMPNCGATREIALAAGAQLQPMEAVLGQGAAAQQPEGEGSNHASTTDLCIFPNRASLEAALRRYITDRRLSGTLIERIGD